MNFKKSENKWDGNLDDPLYRATLIDVLESHIEQCEKMGLKGITQFFKDEKMEMIRLDALMELQEKYNPSAVEEG